LETALILLAIQGMLGAWDTLYYHEWRLKLHSQASARKELALHGCRNFAYAILFGTIGWITWNGLLAWALFGLLLVEILITLVDFLEEDRTRKLPAGERAGHAVMGIVYGLFLGYVVPEIWRWTSLPTGIGVVDHSPVAWLLSIMAVGVLSFGIRDLVGARRLRGFGLL
jgi:hypothetical protein